MSELDLAGKCVLVTGATGFIGSHVVRALKTARAEVRALVRAESNTRNIDGLAAELVEGDVRDAESVSRAITGCAVVFHVAALYPGAETGSRDVYDTNLGGTRNIINGCLKNDVRRLVHTSTIGTIGTVDSGLPNEETPFNLWNGASDYARSKYMAEREVLEAAGRGLEPVVVNPCAPVGEGDVKPSASGKRIVDFLNGKMPHYLKGGLNWIDVRDVAAGHLLAAQKGIPGQRYILGNRNLSKNEFLTLLEAASGLKRPRRRAIRKFVRNMGRRPVSRAPAALVCDVSKAVTELSLPQSPLDDAFARATTWFCDNGYVTTQPDRRTT